MSDELIRYMQKKLARQRLLNDRLGEIRRQMGHPNVRPGQVIDLEAEARNISREMETLNAEEMPEWK
jgi:hypothetical protein